MLFTFFNDVRMQEQGVNGAFGRKYGIGSGIRRSQYGCVILKIFAAYWGWNPGISDAG